MGITVLRNERETGQQALLRVHMLSGERDDLVRSMQELEKSLRDHEKRREDLEGTISTHQSHSSAMEGQLRDATAQLEAFKASLQVVKDRDSHTQTHAELRVAEAERLASEKEQQNTVLLEVLKETQQQMRALHEGFVKQTKDFSQFMERVRLKQQKASSFLSALAKQIAVHWDNAQGLPQLLESAAHEHFGVEEGRSQEADKLHETNRQSQHHLEQTQDTLDKIVAENARLIDKEHFRVSARRMRHKHILYTNILPQMKYSCIDGAILQKVNQEKGQAKPRCEPRRVILDEDSMKLTWSKTSPSRITGVGSMLSSKGGDRVSSMLIADIIFIGFGCMTRAHRLYPDVPPWLCFAVHTVERSYDFICKDVSQAECFVLSISRLSLRLWGWPVPGCIPTHAKFVCATGWTKIEHVCRTQRLSLAFVLMEGIKSAAKQRDEGGGVGLI